MNNFYITNFGKLINTEVIEQPNVIPSSWYQYGKTDVDTKTKRESVQNGVRIWIDWETEAQQFYNQAYKELI